VSRPPKVSVWKHPKTGIYHLNWREPLGGGRYRRHRPSTGHRDKRAAEAIARTQARELAAETAAPAPSAETVLLLVRRFLDFAEVERARSTFEDYRSRLAVWLRWLTDQGVTHLDQLQPDHLQGFKAWKVKSCARPTVNAYVRTVRACTSWGVRAGLLDHDPFLYVKQFRRTWDEPVKRLDPDEERRLFAALRAAPLIERRICLLARGCGLRRGELVWLLQEQVDLAHAAIEIRATTYHTPKSRAARWVAIPEPLLPMVRDQLTTAGPFLFNRPDGSARPYLHPRRLLKHLAPYFEAAGIEKGRRLHALRHTFGSSNGAVGIDTLRELMGHSSLTTTDRYCNVPRATVLAAAPLLTVPDDAAALASEESVASVAKSSGHTPENAHVTH